ncbi:MAG: SUF system Fe-S cluster assembly regulator [Planctomycetes bacterium]|jgi:FeS assembly SUF system regulator|nr:SUF system Fe-S cluster assembly regulator [Planctomycetota bacterium]
MLRISKLTDYGIVLLVHFAREDEGCVLNAREMAEATELPLPVVSKMLKSLSGADLLVSQRGARGGYQLARAPGRVSVAEIIEALEGPIVLMECVGGAGECGQESHCDLQTPWHRINQAIQTTLRKVTLADLAQDGGPTGATHTPTFALA